MSSLDSELERASDDLDPAHKPGQVGLVAALGSLGHEQIRHDGDALVAEELSAEDVGRGQVGLLGREGAGRADGEVAALVLVHNLGEDTERCIMSERERSSRSSAHRGW